MLTIHRDGELAVQVPREVEDEGDAAIEAYVEATHAKAGPEALEAYNTAREQRAAYQAGFAAAQAEGKQIPDCVAAGRAAAGLPPLPQKE